MQKWRSPVVAVLRFDGVIGMGGRLREGFNAQIAIAAMEKAYHLRNVKAVALVINSPGGSPAQSSLIYKTLQSLKAETGKKTYAFIEDAAASGGYYIACGADEIYCDENSIIGSIGVISSGFGLHEAIAKLGVKRRVYSAGENKSFADPFRPEVKKDVLHLQKLQMAIHETFKSVVRQSRGAKLTGEESEIMSGNFWTGTMAVEYGLVDGIGDLRQTMRGMIGENLRFRRVAFSSRRFLFWPFHSQLSATLLDDVIARWKAQLLWNRIGL